ncbi:MAG: DNRLRE domain-containing protein [Terriglobia bacterium]
MRKRANWNIFVRLLLGVFLVFPGPALRADEVTTLTAVADAALEEAFPNANSGSVANLVLSSVGGENTRGIFRFDLSSIVSTAAVKTSIFTYFQLTTTANSNLALHRVTGTTQWTELGVTWNSRNGATNWTTAGGDFNATAVDIIAAGTMDNVTQSWTVLSDGTITNIPQGWLDSPASNLGLVLKYQTENTGQEVEYESRESMTPSQRPQLDVHFLRDVTLGAATPGISEVTWTWTFPVGSTAANYDGALFAKKLGPTASFVFTPTDGTAHTVGEDLGNGESVAINTASFATVSAVDENGADSVVLPTTTYTYKAFNHDATTITGAATPAPPHYAFGVSGDVTTLTGGGTSKNWSYLTGATTLAPPGLIPGSTVVTGSNDNKVHSMSSTTGGRNYRPVAPIGTTGGAIQSRPPVIPAASTSHPTCTGVCDVVYVGAGDGKVYAFRTDTGAKLWESAVLTSGGGSIQGGAAVQVKAFSNAGFTPTTDLVIVGTRNVGSTTNNSVVALNGDTGAVVWTFAPGNLDIINSTPLVDLTNNVVWVTSRSAGGTGQPSVWKLDSNTGALLASFSLGDIDGSPTLNSDGKQVYAVTTGGSLVAVRTDIPSCTFTTSPATGAGVGFPLPISAGANTDDIFFSTATTLNKANFVYGAATCTGTFTTPATGWTNPALTSPSAPIFTPSPLTLFLYVGDGTGRLRKIDPSTGAIAASRDVNLGATVGGPSFDVVSSKFYVGDSSGRIYSFDLF